MRNREPKKGRQYNHHTKRQTMLLKTLHIKLKNWATWIPQKHWEWTWLLRKG